MRNIPQSKKSCGVPLGPKCLAKHTPIQEGLHNTVSLALQDGQKPRPWNLRCAPKPLAAKTPPTPPLPACLCGKPSPWPSRLLAQPPRRAAPGRKKTATLPAPPAQLIRPPWLRLLSCDDVPQLARIKRSRIAQLNTDLVAGLATLRHLGFAIQEQTALELAHGILDFLHLRQRSYKMCPSFNAKDHNAMTTTPSSTTWRPKTVVTGRQTEPSPPQRWAWSSHSREPLDRNVVPSTHIVFCRRLCTVTHGHVARTTPGNVWHCQCERHPTHNT